VIPVARIREALEPFARYERWRTAKGMKTHPPAMGPKEVRCIAELFAELPASGCVLSAEEVAQIREALFPHACTWKYGCKICRAALALLDGADDQSAASRRGGADALLDGADENAK